MVRLLCNQAGKLSCKVEIILLDDGSFPQYRQQYKLLETLPSIAIKYNEDNKGRQSSRKALAEVAEYDYLLFLDCDSRIIRNNFLEVYAGCTAAAESSVFSGGRVYQKEKPSDCSKVLHWKYGTKRESFFSGMQLKETLMFHSNNFLIRKEIFLKLPYLDGIKAYGHEDTFWGIVMHEAGVKIQVIDNPVLHDDVESAGNFIEKSREALYNLNVLSKSIHHDVLKKHVRLFRVYKMINYYRLAGFVLFSGFLFEKIILANLRSCNPSLILFDLYRLSHFIQIQKRNR